MKRALSTSHQHKPPPPTQTQTHTRVLTPTSESHLRMIPPSCEVTSVRFISVQNTRVTRPLGALIPKMVLAVCCAMSSSSLTTWIMGELRAGGRAHARWHARVSVCVCAYVQQASAALLLQALRKRSFCMKAYPQRFLHTVLRWLNITEQ